MKDFNFSIKISDLLNQVGSSDEVVFEKKFSSQISNLDENGISGIFVIQSLDEKSLFGTLHNVKCTLHEICDSCQSSYLREVLVPEYTARFVFIDDKIKEENMQSDEEIFLIDPKNETIDIEDMLVQSILLNEPFVKRCLDCQQKFDAQTNDEDELPEFFGKGNIHFG